MVWEAIFTIKLYENFLKSRRTNEGFLPFSKGQVPPAKTWDVTAVLGAHI